MSDLIQREDQEYRRGVVLGLTMAEVVILLIFCLLMALMASLLAAEEEIESVKSQVAYYEDEAGSETYVVQTQTIELMEQLVGDISSQADFNENFRNLVSSYKEIERLRADSEKLKELEDALATLPEDVPAAELLTAAAQQFGDEPDPVQALSDITKSLAKEKEGRQLCEQRAGDQRAQVQSCQTQLAEAGGKGLQFQSCWYDKTSVPWSTENILDVALTDAGIVIRDIDASDRALEKRMLPIYAELTFQQPLSPNAFLAQTRRLFEYSVGEGCRFFVRVFDVTGPASKDLYKTQLSTVEQHFYKELTSRPFEVTE